MNNKSDLKNASTPKRRRLGTGRIASSLFWKESNSSFINPVNSLQTKYSSQLETNVCDSPPLPCNQIEFLSESSSVKITSPTNVDCSLIHGIEAENWESPVATSKHRFNKTLINKSGGIENVNRRNESEYILDDMFYSKLESQKTIHDNSVNINKDNNKATFKQSIVETFEKFDQSIGEIVHKNDGVDNLFDTKDSFLLDIRETSIENININNKNQVTNKCNHEIEKTEGSNCVFYGLPVITKNLFKMYRNIERFYGEFKSIHWILKTNLCQYVFKKLLVGLTWKS